MHRNSHYRILTFLIAAVLGLLIVGAVPAYAEGQEDKPTESTTAPVSCEHEFGDWTVTEEATCQHAGSRTRKCTKCQEVQTEEIPQKEHQFGDWMVSQDPSCKSEGKKVRECSVCGEKQTGTIPPVGHTFGQWETIKKATCKEEGSRSRKCSECNASENQTIPRTEHQFGTWKVTQKATCAQKGQETAICSVCGKKETRETEKLAHSFGKWQVTKEATCTREGQETAVCTVCGEKETRPVAVIGHKVTDWKTEKEATCTEEGLESGKCSVCGEKQTRKLPKLPHTFQWIPETMSTAFAAGTGHPHCTVCGFDGPEEEAPAHKMLSGGNAVWNSQEETSLQFRLVGELSWLTGISVDGKQVTSGNYTVNPGSQAVTLKETYLETLPAGEHKLEFRFTDGTGATAFTVDTEPTVTGEPTQTIPPKQDYEAPEPDSKLKLAAQIGVGILVAAAAVGGICLIVVSRRNRF